MCLGIIKRLFCKKKINYYDDDYRLLDSLEMQLIPNINN